MTVPLSALTDHWTSGGTVYDAISMNVTDDASAAESTLINLKVGSTTKFKVRKDGAITGSNFTAALQGLVPASGGGSSNFLRADGAWAAPPGGDGGGAGGSPGQVQFNNSGVIDGDAGFTYDDAGNAALTGIFTLGSDVLLRRTAAGLLSQYNGANPQGLHLYNSHTGDNDWERLALDWNTTANTATIATQKSGSGAGRSLSLTSSGTDTKIFFNPCGNSVGAVSNEGGFVVEWQSVFGWYNGALWNGSMDTCLVRQAAKVVGFATWYNSGPTAWFCYAGQKRVSGDFSKTNDTNLADVTGLSVSLGAIRHYAFEVWLDCSCAAAGGVKAAIGGNCTVTDLRYVGYVVADNAIKGKAEGTALGAAVASTTTTETDGVIIVIKGLISTNAAGTLTVQFAQNTSNGTASIVKRGSHFIVQDIV